MSAHFQTATALWNQMLSGGVPLHSDPSFLLTINPTLSEDRRVIVLETSGGQVMAAVTPELVSTLNLVGHPVRSPDAFRQRLIELGVTLNSADCVFYFSEADKQSLRDDPPTAARALTNRDTAAFAEFRSAAAEQDMENAFVELDHWAVFGAFEKGRLVSAASAYPWGGVQIADIGVLTLEPYRGRGHARGLVRSLSKYAISRGFEPQYRCQLDNEASLAVASAAGLTFFGRWQVVSASSTDPASS